MTLLPRWLSAFVVVQGFVSYGMLFADEQPTPGKQVGLRIVSQADPSEGLSYLLFLPKDYGTDNRKWPVMLFLHGSGERGDDLKLVKVHGPPKLVESRSDFPFIVVSPQCPQDRSWQGSVQQHLLAELLDSVMTRFTTDHERICVTGLSMGGFGSWTLAARYPARFSAAVPICGGGDPSDAAQLKSVPFWVFHGAKDTGVPLKLSEEMVDAVQKVGGHAKLTVYPEAGHDSWTETYQNEAVYDWLLAQRREAPASLPTAKADVAFARLGSLDLKLGDPADKNTFAATIYLNTSLAAGPALREKVTTSRDKLLTEITAWVNSQSLEQLIGNAGRERSRVAIKDLCNKALLSDASGPIYDVVFDIYQIRSNGRLKLEAK